MNILMMSNTYLPFVGGVERSIETFKKEYQRSGHSVLVVTPQLNDKDENENDILRVPAIQHFNGTDFSVQLPIPGILSNTLKQFRPDIVHSHHPFMLGDSALRVAAQFRVPLVYTFHTFYERYTHYVPMDSAALKRFVIALSTGYANLCDRVFAPSLSVAMELRRRGVVSDIDVVPTGIDIERFNEGNGPLFRSEMDIDPDSFLIGFVSRIAPEKNVEFLINSIIHFMKDNSDTNFLIIGRGPSEDWLWSQFEENELTDRVYWAGTLEGQRLVDAYHAMDLFVFASKTETQGLVITEAMAAGLPVVALDGPAVNEIVKDFENGRLINTQDRDQFCDAISWVKGAGRRTRNELRKKARATAEPFSKDRCASRALSIYSQLLLMDGHHTRELSDSMWLRAKRMIKAELDLIKNMTRATGAAISD
jgi:1,2-diacylglycerol 3-alpha-glucosyltransferase